MGKVDPGIVGFSGKVEKHVFANRKNKKYIRRLPAKGSKKNEAALKNNYTRTAALNKLAGSLNNEFKEFLRHYRRTDLYQHLLHCFRKTDSKNRFVLLSQLKDAELDPKYPLHKYINPQLNFSFANNRIICEVKTNHQPVHRKKEFNSWYFDLLLLQWETGKDNPDAERMMSEWVDIDDPVPVFEFEFPQMKKGREWMLVLRIRWGQNKILRSDLSASSAQIVEVNSFCARDLSQLEDVKKRMKTKLVKKFGEEEWAEAERVRAKNKS